MAKLESCAIERIAETVKASVSQIRSLANEMLLTNEIPVSESQLERSYLTIIRRNWHLLPEDQLLTLLDWTEEQLNFTLVEDDFFYIKLGSFKPRCRTIDYSEAMNKVNDSDLLQFKKHLSSIFPNGLPNQEEPFFHFVEELSQPSPATFSNSTSMFSPRLAYPYFALFGDPLLSESTTSYPDEYLDKMREKGVAEGFNSFSKFNM